MKLSFTPLKYLFSMLSIISQLNYRLVSANFYFLQWVFTEQACSMFSMVTIALYDTLGPDTCAYIINQSEYFYGYYSTV